MTGQVSIVQQSNKVQQFYKPNGKIYFIKYLQYIPTTNIKIAKIWNRTSEKLTLLIPNATQFLLKQWNIERLRAKKENVYEIDTGMYSLSVFHCIALGTADD